MAEISLNLPLSEADVRKLRFGDVIYVTGILYTARDEAHKRAMEYYDAGKKLPVELEGFGIYHCGPIMQKSVSGEWRPVAAGPTTSARMERYMPQIIEYYRPRIIIGKGGMGTPTVSAMKKFGCVYLAFPGGAAVVGANCIKKVHAVHWLELGMPEALWVIEVNKFGPLIVTIDTNGNSLHETVDRTVHHNYSCLLNK